MKHERDSDAPEMTALPLVLGLLASPPGAAGDAETARLRSLTLSWSRYFYSGEIIERSHVGAILDAALDGGHAHCLILSPGLVLSEEWVPEHWREPLLLALRRWLVAHPVLAAGSLTGGALDLRCLLVDLGRYRAAGRPDLAALPASAPELADLPEALALRLVDLRPSEAPAAPAQARFLRSVEAQIARARRGVFLFNIEPYDDVAAPPGGAPLSTLYSVAAGFKPSWILRAHGATEAARVVYVDYSPDALAVKQLCLAEWDGDDFPSFIRHIFRRFPHPATFYQLWADRTPDDVDDADIERIWQDELSRWGGAAAFKEAWARHRRLRHDFICCDLLSDHAALLSAMTPAPGAVIWWSNAFFTVATNWKHPVTERRALYERWIEALADRDPGIWIYGSDHNNVSVNGFSAGEYRSRYREGGGDPLSPRRLGKVEIRM